MSGERMLRHKYRVKYIFLFYLTYTQFYYDVNYEILIYN